jgi:hypothetical protein
VRQRKALEKVLGADACPTREKPVKMELAQSCALCQRSQVRLLCVVLVKVAKNARNAFVITHVSIVASDRWHSHPFLAPTWPRKSSRLPPILL